MKMIYEVVNEIIGKTDYIVGKTFAQACEANGYNPNLWEMVSQKIF